MKGLIIFVLLFVFSVEITSAASEHGTVLNCVMECRNNHTVSFKICMTECRDSFSGGGGDNGRRQHG